MLDVLHFLFEEDLKHGTAEEEKAQTQIRTNLYREFYNETYKYGTKANSGNNAGGAYISNDLDIGEPEDSHATEEIKPFNPRAKAPVKPYFKPTEIDPDAADPFGGALDSPFR